VRRISERYALSHGSSKRGLSVEERQAALAFSVQARDVDGEEPPVLVVEDMAG